MADPEDIQALLQGAYPDEPHDTYRDPAIATDGYLPGQGLPQLPREGGSARPFLEGKGKAKQELTSDIWEMIKALYGRATAPSSTVHANRQEAQIGVDPSLPWADYYDATMRNFMDRAREAVPGLNSGTAAYDAYFDPEHPITQEKQNTKDAAINAGLAAFELGMPWLARNYANTMTAPPATSRHPNQLGENIYASLPAMAAAWYGMRPLPGTGRAAAEAARTIATESALPRNILDKLAAPPVLSDAAIRAAHREIIPPSAHELSTHAGVRPAWEVVNDADPTMIGAQTGRFYRGPSTPANDHPPGPYDRNTYNAALQKQREPAEDAFIDALLRGKAPPRDPFRD